MTEPNRALKLQPAYSVTENIEDPNSWSPAALLFPQDDPAGVSKWIDFWVICDAKRAYLFFTSMDGKMWRMSTAIEQFPKGFDHCELALRADIFEAAHVYRVGAADGFLAVIEAQGGTGRRYYQAFLADTLDGKWRPLADSEGEPFAGAANVTCDQERWTENISHGELIRAGYDETMRIDAKNLRFLIQGVSEKDKAGKKYGDIPWRLGILTVAGG